VVSTEIHWSHLARQKINKWIKMKIYLKKLKLNKLIKKKTHDLSNLRELNKSNIFFVNFL